MVETLTKGMTMAKKEFDKIISVWRWDGRLHDVVRKRISRKVLADEIRNARNQGKPISVFRSEPYATSYRSVTRYQISVNRGVLQFVLRTSKQPLNKTN